MRIPCALHAGVSALLFAHVACAAGAAEEQTAPLTLKLSLAQTELVQNEPAVLGLKITNVSKTTQDIDPALEPDFGSVTYEITGPEGKPQRYAPLFHSSRGIPKFQELAPNESLCHRQLLLVSPNWGVHFKMPGEYSVRAAFHTSRGEGPPLKLRSNAVKLTVRAVAGVDAEAMEHFRGNPQVACALGFSTDWVIAREFQTIVEKYPDSAYAPWSHYFLGRFWQRARVSQERVKADRAIPHFQILIKKYPDFPLAVEVRYLIAKEMLRLGRKEEALERMKKLFEAHPDLHLFQRAKAQINTYQKRGLEIPIDALPE